MLNKVKRLFQQQSTGVVLCILALFGIGNTLYLNQIRDAKQENLDALAQTLDDYQDSLQRHQQNDAPALKPFLKKFRYGGFLKAALPVFQTTGPNIHITELTLTEEELLTATSLASKQESRHKKPPERQPVLLISGQIQDTASSEGPYHQLDSILTQIQSNTGCQLTLEKAMSTLDLSEAANKLGKPAPFAFTLSLHPAQQHACAKRYSTQEASG